MEPPKRFSSFAPVYKKVEIGMDKEEDKIHLYRKDKGKDIGNYGKDEIGFFGLGLVDAHAEEDYEKFIKVADGVNDLLDAFKDWKITSINFINYSYLPSGSSLYSDFTGFESKQYGSGCRNPLNDDSIRKQLTKEIKDKKVLFVAGMQTDNVRQFIETLADYKRCMEGFKAEKIIIPSTCVLNTRKVHEAKERGITDKEHLQRFYDVIIADIYRGDVRLA